MFHNTLEIGCPIRWTWAVASAHLMFGSTLCLFAFVAYAKAVKVSQTNQSHLKRLLPFSVLTTIMICISKLLKASPGDWTVLSPEAKVYYGSTNAIADVYQSMAISRSASSFDYILLLPPHHPIPLLSSSIFQFSGNSNHLGWLAIFSGGSLLLSGWGLMNKARAAPNGWYCGLPLAT